MNFFRNHIVIELALILYWCAYLSKSDAHIAPYLLVGLLALYFAVVRSRSAFAAETFSKSETRVTNGFAFLLASTVVLANYKMFVGADDGGFLAALASGRFKAYQGIAEALLLWGIGFWLFKEILIGVAGLDGIKADSAPIKNKKLMFGILGSVMALFYALFLFGSQYPGELTPDSIYQMTQLLTHSYSNHHPYYHTQIIHAVIAVGLKVFGDINRAVALYSVFSILVMTFSFLYVVETVYTCTQNRKILLVVFLFYLLMPFHIMYSMTMWKDVFFGASVTCFAVSCYRCLQSVGNGKWNWMMLLLASFGMGLLRSNGWVALFVSTMAFVVLFRKKYKKMFFLFAVVLLATFILKHPVLSFLQVTQPDTIESLSIPAQQIARVIVDGKTLTEEQSQIVSKVIDIDQVPKKYKNFISDPVKHLVRQKGNQKYLRQHPAEFLKLYWQLGLRYPHEYVKAWIDQTRGYWNGGYSYWRWSTGVKKNTLGIKRTVKSQFLDKALKKYLKIWETSPFLQLFLSIGLYVWGIVLLSYRAVMRRNREVLFATIPFLAVIATLLIATPVFAEFRYAYAIFCGFPFLLAIAFAKNPKEGRCEKRITVNGRR